MKDYTVCIEGDCDIEEGRIIEKMGGDTLSYMIIKGGVKHGRNYRSNRDVSA